jgi:hypothetical protein
MLYTIDKGIPVGTSTRRGESKYPWPQMESGDSVLLPVVNGDIEGAQRKYSNNARSWMAENRPNWRVITRREGNSIRVWLVDDKATSDEQDTEIDDTIYALMDMFEIPATSPIREAVYHRVTDALSNYQQDMP